jgi:hypothetical protein
MSYFKESVKNIGSIRKGKIVKVQFEALHTIPVITNLISSCGCAKVVYDPMNRMLNVTYKAGNIPKHITGNQNINASISVYYNNGQSEVLNIKGLKLR